MTGGRRLVVNLDDARPVWRVPEWVLEQIRRAAPESWEVAVVRSPADGRGDGGAPTPEVVRALAGAEVYLGYGFPRELFQAAAASAPGLRWVHSAAAGVRGSLYPEMRRSPLVLTNSAGVHAEPIAESVLGMMLHFARGLDFAVRAQARAEWDKRPFEAERTPVREIGGATLGVLGFGGVGQAVARRAVALGMEVLAVRRTPADPPAGVRLLTGDEGVRTVLRGSDYLLVALPDTDRTRGMIGAAELAALPTGATLINVGRGEVVDEQALLAALRAGHLRGAALDVFAEEPLPARSPLWALPNVLVTPHVSGTSRGFWGRQVELIVDNLRRYLGGEPLRNVVDKDAGY